MADAIFSGRNLPANIPMAGTNPSCMCSPRNQRICFCRFSRPHHPPGQLFITEAEAKTETETETIRETETDAFLCFGSFHPRPTSWMHFSSGRGPHLLFSSWRITCHPGVHRRCREHGTHSQPVLLGTSHGTLTWNASHVNGPEQCFPKQWWQIGPVEPGAGARPRGNQAE
jgi:hypothetical protein